MSAHGAYSLSDLQPTPTPQGHYTLSDLAESPSSNDYQPGALHAIGQDLLGFGRGILTMGGAAFGNPTAREEFTEGLVNQIQNAPDQYKAEKQAGYNLPYRLTAPLAGLVGVNVPAMEQAAAHGDVGGVLGHTVVPTAAALTPLAVEGALRGANAVIPSTPRSGAGLSTLETVHAAQPVTPVLATDAASDIAQRLGVTGERPHPLIQTFQDRMNAADLAARHPEIAQGLADRGIDVSNPLTFSEARTFLKRANELKYDSNIGQSAKNQLSQFADALDRDISAAAQQGGFGDDYAAMRNEYRRGSKIIRTADKVGPYIGAGLGYEVGRRMGEPIGGTIIGGMAGKALAKPVIGGLVRSVIERDAGAPSLSSVPRPVPASPAEYTRILLNAKNGDISPGEADRQIVQRGGKVRVNPLPSPPQ